MSGVCSVTAAMAEVTSGSMTSRQGPYISMVTNRTTNLLIRGAMLFGVGVFLALVLNLLQVQRNVTLFPPDVISSIFSSAWWVPPCCGTASGNTRCQDGMVYLTIVRLSVTLFVDTMTRMAPADTFTIRRLHV